MSGTCVGLAGTLLTDDLQHMVNCQVNSVQELGCTYIKYNHSGPKKKTSVGDRLKSEEATGGGEIQRGGAT